jgi:hypothetical protein
MNNYSRFNSLTIQIACCVYGVQNKREHFLIADFYKITKIKIFRNNLISLQGDSRSTVKKFPAFYETRRFISMFVIRTCH